jgi:hypothetical protein
MSASDLSLALLAVIAACAVVMTIAGLSMVQDLRQMSQETRYAIRQVRRLLARGENATRHVEAVVIRACESAAEALERLGEVRQAARHWFTGKGRNGARGGPRLHHRRGA